MDDSPLSIDPVQHQCFHALQIDFTFAKYTLHTTAAQRYSHVTCFHDLVFQKSDIHLAQEIDISVHVVSGVLLGRAFHTTTFKNNDGVGKQIQDNGRVARGQRCMESGGSNRSASFQANERTGNVGRRLLPWSFVMIMPFRVTMIMPFRRGFRRSRRCFRRNRRCFRRSCRAVFVTAPVVLMCMPFATDLR